MSIIRIISWVWLLSWLVIGPFVLVETVREGKTEMALVVGVVILVAAAMGWSLRPWRRASRSAGGNCPPSPSAGGST